MGSVKKIDGVKKKAKGFWGSLNLKGSTKTEKSSKRPKTKSHKIKTTHQKSKNKTKPKGKQMDRKKFPEEPWKRKVIFVLCEEEIERCQYEHDSGNILYDDQTFVVSYPILANDTNIVLKDLTDSNKIIPGTILLQSPFDDNKYEEMTEAAENFAIEKYSVFTTFCMYLGAKEVEVKQIRLKSEKVNYVIDVESEICTVKSDLKIERDGLERFRSMLSLRVVFQGGKANISEADAYLRKNKLIGDPNMRTLLEMRKFDTNQIKERELNINLSAETNKGLTVLGRLEIPDFVSLNTKVKHQKKRQEDYNLTIRVVF